VLLPRTTLALAVGLLAAAGMAACDDDASEREPRPDGDRKAETRSEARRPAPARPLPLRAPPCPPAVAGCRRASGRIVYVEAVDPDGDGDAHFVLLSDEGITAPGISVVDVKRSLRPRPLPGRGDSLAAAGPVFTGSYGQRQIEAVAVRVRR
jgi:hypothetical protein